MKHLLSALRADHSTRPLALPRSDDRVLWDLFLFNVAYPAFQVALDSNLFEMLGQEPCRLATISQRLGIEIRPAQCLLSLCQALGFVQCDEGQYFRLTPVAEDYLLKQSPTYFGGFFELCLSPEEDQAYSIEAMRQRMRADSSQTSKHVTPFEARLRQPEFVRGLIQAMHSHSMASALAWPTALDLSAHQRLLDIGGGSGAHSIGALSHWPHLHATVFDLEPVCVLAQEYIAAYGFQQRIETWAGDMWHDPFPDADIHLYSHVYHDWSPEKGRLLTEKSFASLPPGGRLVLHEMLFNDEKTGNLAAASFSALMLLWTEGQQYSGKELADILAAAGFVEIEVKPTFGYLSIVTGRKPGQDSWSFSRPGPRV